MQQPLTPVEIKQAASLLARLEPGLLPFDIFIQTSRLVVTSIVEVVPLRMRHDAVEVLLLPRPDDDPYYAGMLHNPGTVLRATDLPKGIESAFERIQHEELAGLATMGLPQFVTSFFRQSLRGPVNVQVFYLELTDAPMVGQFYPVQTLPANLVADQKGYIETAAKQFAESKGLSA